MAYRKKTLRSMSPTTRKLARLIGELESVSRRLRNLVLDIQRLEADSQALFNTREYEKAQSSRTTEDIFSEAIEGEEE